MADAARNAGLKLLLGPGRAPGDFWGGLAAMLVALPAAIAFGVTVYAAIAPNYAAFGALAGIIGATVIGLIASLLGGTDRLISAPCAPAAAVLSAFAIELVSQGIEPDVVVVLLIMLGILAGVVQVLLGIVGVGRLVRYIPYPVVSGYLSGVGLIIIGSQLPKIVGATPGTQWWTAVFSPWLWDWRSLVVGAATMAGALFSPGLTRKVPATVFGILAGFAAYFGLALMDPALMQVADNPLVVGPLGAAGKGYLEAIGGRWHEIGELTLAQVANIFGSALTLAALLSIDTLKTCLVVDELTRTRHDPNRELVAQGIANVCASGVGGIPGAGTMAATLVNLSGGAQTRASGVLEGLFALAAALLLGSFVAWTPVAALAGILIVVGARMIDRQPLRFIESRATVFDFAVVFAVIVVALTIGLMAASAVGVALAILLFVREQIGGAVVRHKVYLNQTSSTWHRPEAEMQVLEKKGDQAVILELQGSLFFGTARQLLAALENEIRTRNFVILDLKRVQSVDATAAHVLVQVREALQERGARLLLSSVRETLPNGRNLPEFFNQTGVLRDNDDTVRMFSDLDAAVEWVEERILGGPEAMAPDETPMQLHEMDIFAGRKDETLKDLEARMVERAYKAGETIYARGAAGDEIYWIRRGTVRVFAPLGAGRTRHIASFDRGDFFGALAFLDGRPRSDDAVAHTDTEVYVLTREQFEQLAETHKRLAFTLANALARTLAMRLRHADTELAMLQEY